LGAVDDSEGEGAGFELSPVFKGLLEIFSAGAEFGSFWGAFQREYYYLA